MARCMHLEQFRISLHSLLKLKHSQTVCRMLPRRSRFVCPYVSSVDTMPAGSFKVTTCWKLAHLEAAIIIINMYQSYI